jgi:hypothetical protein
MLDGMRYAQENDRRNDREPRPVSQEENGLSIQAGFVQRNGEVRNGAIENTPDESQKECDLVR